MNTQSCENHLVRFSSSNPEIASVDEFSGLLHANCLGEVTITAVSASEKTASMTLVVDHDWEEITYQWTNYNSRVKATRACAADASHTVTETVDAVRELITAPTETTAGSYRIVSKPFANEAFEVQSKTDLVIRALKNLKVLRLPASLKKIEAEAFVGLTAEAVIIPSRCTSITSRAFVNCKKLLYVLVPAGINIPADAFEGCPNVVIDKR